MEEGSNDRLAPAARQHRLMARKLDQFGDGRRLVLFSALIISSSPQLSAGKVIIFSLKIF